MPLSKKYDEYVHSDDGPKELCHEIDELKRQAIMYRNEISILKEQINDMKNHLNCNKFYDGFLDGTTCCGNGDCSKCPDWECR